MATLTSAPAEVTHTVVASASAPTASASAASTPTAAASPVVSASEASAVMSAHQVMTRDRLASKSVATKAQWAEIFTANANLSVWTNDWHYWTEARVHSYADGVLTVHLNCCSSGELEHLTLVSDWHRVRVWLDHSRKELLIPGTRVTYDPHSVHRPRVKATVTSNKNFNSGPLITIKPDGKDHIITLEARQLGSLFVDDVYLYLIDPKEDQSSPAVVSLNGAAAVHQTSEDTKSISNNSKRDATGENVTSCAVTSTIDAKTAAHSHKPTFRLISLLRFECGQRSSSGEPHRHEGSAVMDCRIGVTAGEILDSLTETFKRLIAPCCSEPGTSNANRLAPFIVLDRQNFTIQLVKYANPKSPTSGTHNSAVEKVNADIYNRPAADLPPKTRIVDVISDSFVIYDSDELEITYSYIHESASDDDKDDGPFIILRKDDELYKNTNTLTERMRRMFPKSKLRDIAYSAAATGDTKDEKTAVAVLNSSSVKKTKSGHLASTTDPATKSAAHLSSAATASAQTT